MKIYGLCNELSDEFYDRPPIRQISVTISNLEDETSMEGSFFEAYKWGKRKLASAMDAIS